MSISLLQMLEAGEFPEIGPPNLVHAFLLAYAQALGVNQPHPLDETEAPDAVAHPKPAEPGHETLTTSSPWTGIYGRMATYFVIGMVALGVLFGAGWVLWRDSEHSKHQLSTAVVPPKFDHRSPTPLEASAHQESEVGKNDQGPEHESRTQDDTSRGELMSEPETDRGSPPGPSRANVAEEPVTLSKAIETRPLTPKNDDGVRGASAAPEAQPADPTPQEKPRHRFEIQAVQKSWVQVRIDNKRIESALLQPGEKRGWEVTKEIQIVVGNGGGVQMIWDGEPVDVAARPGQVLRFSLPHPNLTSKSQ